jgi:regulator of sigma E protease
MIATLITILGIATLIVAHEWGHFWAAKKFNLKVEEFGVGFPPRLFKREKGGTVYSLNWLPLGGFVRIAGEGESEEYLEKVPEADRKRLFFFQKPWKKALVVSAGIVMNLLAGWLILTAVFLIGTPPGIIISAVESGSPAEIAGFKVNDIIIGYGEPLKKIDEAEGENKLIPSSNFTAFINSYKGKEIKLLVHRENDEVVISVTPRINPEPDQGALGVRFAEIGIPRQNILSALIKSFQESALIFALTAQSLLTLFQNIFSQATVPEGVVGPIGIFHFAYETGNISIVYLLHFMSLISLNLAVLNLIPLPVLDGGHLLFICIEKIKGSPIRKRTKLVFNTAGVSLLMLLMTVLTFRDIQRIFFS